MEKLFIEYKDGGKITITAKGKTGRVMNRWNTEHARFMQSYKRAWIQKYPKKDNPPIILVGEGV